MAVTGAREFKNLIGGEWVGAVSGETFESLVPATGEALGTFPRSGAEDVDRAVAAAKAAFEEWRLTPAPERGNVLFRFARLLEDQKDELTELMSREMGKVLAEAGGDVQGQPLDTPESGGRRPHLRPRVRVDGAADAHAERRGSRTGSCAGSETSPRCAIRARSRTRSHVRRSSCWRSTTKGSSAPTASCCTPSRTSSTAARSACPRSR